MDIYQSSDGTWIVSDGTTKQHFNSYREAVMSARPTAAQEWETAMRAVVDQARQLIRDAQDVSLLAQTNSISEVISNTPPGELLPGTTVTREDAQIRAVAFADMLAWLDEPATGAPELSRLAVIFRRF